jgi:hypothetical protein
MAKKEKGKMTKLWLQAKEIIKEKDPNKTQQLSELLETGILYLAMANLEDGITDDKELIEGVKKETWHERFWIAMENYVWPTYDDYEENWKCS